MGALNGDWMRPEAAGLEVWRLCRACPFARGASLGRLLVRLRLTTVAWVSEIQSKGIGWRKAARHLQTSESWCPTMQGQSPDRQTGLCGPQAAIVAKPT
jgi:hypothetical protein